MTLRTIAGLDQPDRGRVEIGGRVVYDSASGIDRPPQDRGVGYVVQELALFPHMSTYDNIAFPLDRWPRDAGRQRVAELVAMLGLSGLEGRKPGQLSGGQQQRVALARALAAEPRLLLLDEPFTGLDHALRGVLRKEVAELQRRLGLTAVFVTHDLAEAYALADRVVIMDDGAVLQQGAASEVLRRPNSLRVAELTEVRNTIPGEVVAFAEGVSVVQTAWFTARVAGTAPATKVRVCIRPEHVLMLREGHESKDERDAVVTAEIVEDTALGNTHRLVMRTVAADGRPGEPPLLLHVDVAAHPYEHLGVSVKRDWRVVLDASHMTLVPDSAPTAASP
jgi:ABC-type sulfate/molybdate transport systems ATPase subunit